MSNKYVSQAIYHTLQTTKMNFEKAVRMTSFQTTVSVRFSLQVCPSIACEQQTHFRWRCDDRKCVCCSQASPSMSPIVFAFHVLSGYFYASLVCWQFTGLPNDWSLLNFVTQLFVTGLCKRASVRTPTYFIHCERGELATQVAQGPSYLLCGELAKQIAQAPSWLHCVKSENIRACDLT